MGGSTLLRLQGRGFDQGCNEMDRVVEPTKPEMSSAHHSSEYIGRQFGAVKDRRNNRQGSRK